MALITPIDTNQTLLHPNVVSPRDAALFDERHRKGGAVNALLAAELHVLDTLLSTSNQFFIVRSQSRTGGNSHVNDIIINADDNEKTRRNLDIYPVPTGSVLANLLERLNEHQKSNVRPIQSDSTTTQRPTASSSSTAPTMLPTSTVAVVQADIQQKLESQTMPSVLEPAGVIASEQSPHDDPASTTDTVILETIDAQRPAATTAVALTGLTNETEALMIVTTTEAVTINAAAAVTRNDDDDDDEPIVLPAANVVVNPKDEEKGDDDDDDNDDEALEPKAVTVVQPMVGKQLEMDPTPTEATHNSMDTIKVLESTVVPPIIESTTAETESVTMTFSPSPPVDGEPIALTTTTTTRTSNLTASTLANMSLVAASGHDDNDTLPSSTPTETVTKKTDAPKPVTPYIDIMQTLEQAASPLGYNVEDATQVVQLIERIQNDTLDTDPALRLNETAILAQLPTPTLVVETTPRDILVPATTPEPIPVATTNSKTPMPAPLWNDDPIDPITTAVVEQREEEVIDNTTTATTTVVQETPVVEPQPPLGIGSQTEMDNGTNTVTTDDVTATAATGVPLPNATITFATEPMDVGVHVEIVTTLPPSSPPPSSSSSSETVAGSVTATTTNDGTAVSFNDDNITPKQSSIPVSPLLALSLDDNDNDDTKIANDSVSGAPLIADRVVATVIQSAHRTAATEVAELAETLAVTRDINAAAAAAPTAETATPASVVGGVPPQNTTSPVQARTGDELDSDDDRTPRRPRQRRRAAAAAAAQHVAADDGGSWSPKRPRVRRRLVFD